MGYLFLSSWIYLHFNTANLTWVLTFSSIPLPLLKPRCTFKHTHLSPSGKNNLFFYKFGQPCADHRNQCAVPTLLVESPSRFYKWCWAQENHLMLVGTLFFFYHLQAAAHGALHNPVSCPRMEYLKPLGHGSDSLKYPLLLFLLYLWIASPQYLHYQKMSV